MQGSSFSHSALRHFHGCVSVDDAKTVATALVSSPLDYCNSILYGTSSSNLNKLQHVQNALVRTSWWPKTRSHHTDVSPSSLAPCYCPRPVHNRAADIRDTHYPSAELHSWPTPAALLIMTIQVHQSQPAWNSMYENQFCSTQFHLQCSTHLEQSTSHHHWQLGRHCKHFQKET